ncbi:MAG TPA: outer membrane beta-barrel protein [Puia sp.]|jgi:outer membrane receptor protein involved in Fe transport|nr:outer membrane beta-barrel protein [Puia sp.]
MIDSYTAKKACLILFVFFSLAGFSQMPGGAPSGRQVPSIGHFYGKIVDEKTNKGIEGVSVQLIQSKVDTATHQKKDVAIAGMITGKKGEFNFENLPIFGNFHLKISAMGYKPYDQKVAFDLNLGRGAAQQAGDMQQAMAGVDKDLGNVKLSTDVQTLEQVTVTSSKPLIQLGVDRKIYNVEKDISATGGTGVDVMKNIPSVAVDIDGNVTLRNSTPTIFVDGLPSTLTLDQIPADAIQSVEIITNPGAKFDASGGTSGILNIILKKNRKAGYNGNLRAGIDERGKFNLGGDINAKQGKVNVFANGNFNQRKSIATGNTNRYTFLNTPSDSLRQFDKNINEGYFAFGRLGVDYFIDNRNTLSVSGVIVHGSFTPTLTSDLFVDTLNASGTTSSYTQRLSNTNAIFNNHGGMLSFKHTFPKSGEEWSANANYSRGTNQNTNLVNSNIHILKDGPLSYVFDQQQMGSGDNQYFTAQTDFTNPLTDKSKFETGARAAFRNVNSVNNFYIISPGGALVLSPLQSSQYKFQDQVFAAYATYSNAIKNFGYLIGLRAESSNYQGTTSYAVKSQNQPLKDTLGNFSNSYPISLFPSVFLTQKLGGEQELQLSYSRRIDRPGFFQLFPYIDYSDSLNLSKGNPDLKPQFTNSFELSYQKTFQGNNTFIGSIYYKQTTNLITRFQSRGINPVNDSLVFISTYINASSAFVGGLELIARNTLTKWWDLTSSVNIYTSKINSGDTSVSAAGQTYSWFGKINNSFKLSKKFTLQITGDYTSRTVLPPGGSANNGGGGRGFGQTVTGNAQGYSKPSGGADASLKYEFLKNKAASITFSVSDIFRTRVNDVFTQAFGFIQEVQRRRDPQFFRVQFNYRFGKFDVALFKRKNVKGDSENIQNGMQGVQQ